MGFLILIRPKKQRCVLLNTIALYSKCIKTDGSIEIYSNGNGLHPLRFYGKTIRDEKQKALKLQQKIIYAAPL